MLSWCGVSRTWSEYSWTWSLRYLSREGKDDRCDMKLMISLSEIVCTILLAFSLQQERTSAMRER